MRILLFAGAFSWINAVFGFALIAKERQASALWLNVTALVFNVGLNFLLIPRYGIVVAAIWMVSPDCGLRPSRQFSSVAPKCSSTVSVRMKPGVTATAR